MKMDDDNIIQIDDVLSNSFCMPEETYDEVNNILRQWNDNIDSNNKVGTKNIKSVDTRTFTRPKKKLYETFDKSFNASRGNAGEINGTEQGVANLTEQVNSSINLKIGGLVTSAMGKSFLGDVSPPISMDSSTITFLQPAIAADKMSASLINSNDFTNVNDFINQMDDYNINMYNNNNNNNNEQSVINYNFNDIIKDRNYLDNLTSSCDSGFMKDSSIGKTDQNIIDVVNSGVSTLHNSTDSLGILNETFIPFNTTETKCMATALNETVVLNTSNGSSKNETFVKEDNLCNLTYEKNKTINKVQDDGFAVGGDTMIVNKTFNNIINSETFMDKESHLANQTYEKLNNVYNQTFDCHNDEQHNQMIENNEDINEPITGIQSTPLKKPSLMKRRSIINLSPISSTQESNASFINKLENEVETYDNNKIEIDENDDNMEQVKLRYSNDLNRDQDNHDVDDQLILQLREDERQSLKNFEEFEKSMSLLDNRNEDEFEKLLNNFSNFNLINKNNNKMRESLDNIKKRHSLINLEKQKQQDEQLQHHRRLLNRSNCIDSNSPYTNYSNRSNNGNQQMEYIHNNNRLMDATMTSPLQLSLNKSLPSSNTNNNNNNVITTSTERLLLRRSRLYDDMTPPQQAVNKTTIINDKASELLAVDTVNANDIGGGGDAENNNNEDTNQNIDRKNRDRFKTIRLFKKTPENAVMIPSLDDDENITVQGVYSQNEHFTKKDYNSPVITPTNERNQFNFSNNNCNADEINEAIQQPNNNMKNKPRSLSRPKYISGLKKPDFVLKSNSADSLNNSFITTDNQQRKLYDSRMSITKPGTSVAVTGTPPLKSPMGIKSKSIHNLISSGASGISGGNIKTSSNITIQQQQHNNNNNKSISVRSNSDNISTKLNKYVPSKNSTQLKLIKKNEYYERKPIYQSNVNKRHSTVLQPISNSPSTVMKQNSDENLFKVPTAAPPVQLKRTNARTSLMRPSSGYYSLNVKKTDASDAESERLSINSISSISSKTVKHNRDNFSRLETVDQSPTEELNGGDIMNYNVNQSTENNISTASNNTSFEHSTTIDSSVSNNNYTPNNTNINNTNNNTNTNNSNNSNLGIPRLTSGLRIPSNLRKSALPRPMSFVKK